MASSTYDNAIAYLQEFCQKNHLKLPIYDEIDETGPDNCKRFVIRCTFGEYSETGTEGNKKSAKKCAAKRMMEYLVGIDYFNKWDNTQSKAQPEEETDEDGALSIKPDDIVIPDNAIGYLQEYCQQFNIPLPLYGEVERNGVDHCKAFTVRCQFKEYSVTGIASSKQLAKKESAKQMINFLLGKGYFKNLWPCNSKKEESNDSSTSQKDENIDSSTS